MDLSILEKAWRLMCTARAMADLYDENRDIAKYVHSTSKGHEAIQLATAFHLNPVDYISLYYRDESVLLGLGLQPYELMLQLLAKNDDPFSGGRTYYAHPSLKREGFPTIPHQSSATGMQAIPATGLAQGIQYMEKHGLINSEIPPIALCSFGDGSVTEGEVAEAFQMAVLHQMPIVYLVQDNDWGISATAKEMRAMDAYEYAAGFKGMKRMRVNGTSFSESYEGMKNAIAYVRENRKPILVHAPVPLLGHHTSGVRKEWYRSDSDLAKHQTKDPFPVLKQECLDAGISLETLDAIQLETSFRVKADWDKAVAAPEPPLDSVTENEFAPTPIIEEVGVRTPEGRTPVVMVDAALHACEEILAKHPEALLYGQDVGRTLGGVFREAATLAEKFGDDRVFNTPIQEAYLVGSTAGMSAVGAKPMVEIQFADYIWTGVNQLVVELSKSCYLTRGKFPISSVIRVPCGAYGGGGPYHSGCIESAILSVRGIKVVYPSNAADMKGLLKAAYYDPNPVIVFEHKGLYWSKVPGTAGAKTVEPDEHYVIPIGKGRVHLEARTQSLDEGDTCCVITYGMGVYWAEAAAKSFPGRVEIIDLRSLYPCDEQLVMETVKKHGKVLVLTEEQRLNSFAEALAGRINEQCFRFLDQPVQVMGALNIPAIALNDKLEKEMLPTAEKVERALHLLLNS
jgi:2-oxoisovalerate dehydrogenase E1 component